MASGEENPQDDAVPLLRMESVGRTGLDPVSLDLDAGTCCVIMGPSGAGKTLLLRAVADLDPHVGETYLAGHACSAMPGPRWRRQVTYVAAEPGWWDDHVAPHMEVPTEAVALARRLDLPDDVMAAEVARLSTGERLRLAVIRALIQTPSVLLLDEPTAALDQHAAEKMSDLLIERRDAGLALLIVTHDLGLADRMADQTREMRHGHLDEGSP